ncbi:hypothetical protein [Sporomusa sp. GT1]|uniref:hypothetical protein n=1 Tax=Sporomusa sp. GT1 TaxID=1534747 RepID=UPI001CB7B72D|nr:hypothetical protein [Sporomusa sp. GT1]
MAVHYSNTISFINKAPFIKSQSAKLQSALEQKEKELAKITRYKQAVLQDWKDGDTTKKRGRFTLFHKAFYDTPFLFLSFTTKAYLCNTAYNGIK